MRSMMRASLARSASVTRLMSHFYETFMFRSNFSRSNCPASRAVSIAKLSIDKNLPQRHKGHREGRMEKVILPIQPEKLCVFYAFMVKSLTFSVAGLRHPEIH